MVQLWLVVGGSDKGGIVVREGQDTSSAALARLATKALIEEVELLDDRLHYRLVAGDGPVEGWVSTKLARGSNLCVRTPIAVREVPPEPPVPPTAPTCVRPAREVAPPFRKCPDVAPIIKRMAKKAIVEAASKRLKGDLYGLPFPWAPEELASEEFGAKWLTQAMRAAGSLSEDNAVKSIITMKRFVGGGSGPKGIVVVDYERPDEALDTKLFVKMPWPLSENADQRWVECGQAKFGDNWGGELCFYRWMAPHVPFAVPKLYFADICRESTECILIHGCVAWPEEGKTTFAPYEVLPPCEKCMDYQLKDPHEYYFATMRRLGAFAGLAKAHKLGPEQERIEWYNYGPQQDTFIVPGFPDTEKSVRKFIEEVAPHWFTPEMRDKAYLDKFEAKAKEVLPRQKEINEFLYADPRYIGFHHQNGNVDNCYFYKREDGTIDAGVLDWGSTCKMAYSSGMLGCTVGAMGDMLVEYDERLVAAWLEAFQAQGPPEALDYQELLFRYRLATVTSAYGKMAFALRLTSPTTIEESKRNFAKLASWDCEYMKQDFPLRFGVGSFFCVLVLLHKKGDVYWGALQRMLQRTAGKK